MSGFRFFGAAVSALAVGAFALMAAPRQAFADGSPYIGEVIIVPYNFCPLGWAEANGALRSISENEALFTLCGTTFGGDGENTFGLPDFRGRLPIHAGAGPGLQNKLVGQTGGAESFTLTIGNLPPHNHQVLATNTLGGMGGPGGKILASGNTGQYRYSESAANKLMKSGMLGLTGNSLPVEAQDPYLTMRVCVSLYGIWPSLH
ncbi:phage tail protein [Mesorhizobium sp. J428]|uniref:phage tail protein n=1 Tax=Mesorhizobium sp. J428 TaxID=2898440 RepID=UPI002151E34C|nr:tail fiber protein [Mesorhizobium sp. J428]MCR5856548.1 tail fiber protein [Mesorhizobium sp. J428]